MAGCNPSKRTPCPDQEQGVSKPADSRARSRRPSTAELGAIRSHFQNKKMGVTGHKDLRMLQRYYHPSLTELARKIG